MAVLVVMAVLMKMASCGQGNAIGLAGAGALPLTEIAAIGEALNVVVVAVLGSPHFRFKAEHLGPVLTQGAVHLGVAPHHLGHPLNEGAQHQGVVSQVGSL